MGAVGGLLGLGGGAGGTGFSVNNGTSAGQLQTTYNQNQDATKKQQALLAALQGQGGLQKQGDIYNQLQGVVSGQGPNPAQAMLNQSTGQNVANQAALMAGQRGASANVGLMARQAAQQGANLQQQAAGQGASMQAQQSLNALGQATGQANTMAANQVGQTNANVQAIQNEQGVLQGANSAANSVNGQLANTTLQGQQGLLGGAGNAFGAITHLFSQGGPVLKMAEGGSAFGPQSMFGQNFTPSQGAQVPTFSSNNSGAQELSNMAKHEKPGDPMAGINSSLPAAQQQFNSQMSGPSGQMDASNVGQMQAAGGGKVPAMVSPGEKFLRPQEAKAVAKGVADPMKVGEKIPGQAKVKGDSYANDTVPKKLEAGGIVIPRSVMNSKDPARGAADFVRAVMAKKGKMA